MSVYYKMKNCKDYDSITFDGINISVGDLKRAIMEQKKLGKGDCDYLITDANNPETVYASETDLIPKNSSVIVSRVPLPEKTRKNWDRGDRNSSGANTIPLTKTSNAKSADLLNSYESEEDRIKAMVSQSTDDYDPINFIRTRGLVGPLPSNYKCHRCGMGGHYIKHCPTNNMAHKRSTGIPRSFMMPTSADQKGAMLTATGDYAIPSIDMEAYLAGKKEKPFISLTEMEAAEPEVPIPPELKCCICNGILRDAVLSPCCGESCCDECIRTALVESELECPVCQQKDVSPDTLLPSRKLRRDVIKYLNESSAICSQESKGGIKTSSSEPLENNHSSSLESVPLDPPAPNPISVSLEEKPPVPSVSPIAPPEEQDVKSRQPDLKIEPAEDNSTSQVKTEESDAKEEKSEKSAEESPSTLSPSKESNSSQEVKREEIRTIQSLVPDTYQIQSIIGPVASSFPPNHFRPHFTPRPNFYQRPHFGPNFGGMGPNFSNNGNNFNNNYQPHVMQHQPPPAYGGSGYYPPAPYVQMPPSRPPLLNRYNEPYRVSSSDHRSSERSNHHDHHPKYNSDPGRYTYSEETVPLSFDEAVEAFQARLKSKPRVRRSRSRSPIIHRSRGEYADAHRSHRSPEDDQRIDTRSRYSRSQSRERRLALPPCLTKSNSSSEHNDDSGRRSRSVTKKDSNSDEIKVDEEKMHADRIRMKDEGADDHEVKTKSTPGDREEEENKRTEDIKEEKSEKNEKSTKSSSEKSSKKKKHEKKHRSRDKSEKDSSKSSSSKHHHHHHKNRDRSRDRDSKKEERHKSRDRSRKTEHKSSRKEEKTSSSSHQKIKRSPEPSSK